MRVARRAPRRAAASPPATGARAPAVIIAGGASGPTIICRDDPSNANNRGKQEGVQPGDRRQPRELRVCHSRGQRERGNGYAGDCIGAQRPFGVAVHTARDRERPLDERAFGLRRERRSVVGARSSGGPAAAAVRDRAAPRSRRSFHAAQSWATSAAVASVFAPVGAAGDTVRHDGGGSDDGGGTSHGRGSDRRRGEPCGEQREACQAPSSSSSSAATSAWIGIRPLATSWPPERRTADAKGAAHTFSQTSTAAELSGSSASATLTMSSSLKRWAMSISSFRSRRRGRRRGLRARVLRSSRRHPW